MPAKKLKVKYFQSNLRFPISYKHDILHSCFLQINTYKLLRDDKILDA